MCIHDEAVLMRTQIIPSDIFIFIINFNKFYFYNIFIIKFIFPGNLDVKSFIV